MARMDETEAAQMPILDRRKAMMAQKKRKSQPSRPFPSCFRDPDYAPWHRIPPQLLFLTTTESIFINNNNMNAVLREKAATVVNDKAFFEVVLWRLPAPFL